MKSLFPNLWSVFPYILLGSGFSSLFKLDPSHKAFWIIAIIYIPLLFYFILFKPYFESKIFITKIDLDEIQNEIKIEYLECNKKKQIKVGIKEIEYNIFNSVRIGLADRIIFYERGEKILTQYSNSDWSVAKMNDVAESFYRIGVMKPFGYNK